MNRAEFQKIYYKAHGWATEKVGADPRCWGDLLADKFCELHNKSQTSDEHAGPVVGRKDDQGANHEGPVASMVDSKPSTVNHAQDANAWAVCKTPGCGGRFHLRDSPYAMCPDCRDRVDAQDEPPKSVLAELPNDVVARILGDETQNAYPLGDHLIDCYKTGDTWNCSPSCKLIRAQAQQERAEGYEPACGRCLARTEKACTCLTPAENE